MADENIGNLSVGVTADLSDADQQLQDFVDHCVAMAAKASDGLNHFGEVSDENLQAFILQAYRI